MQGVRRKMGRVPTAKRVNEGIRGAGETSGPMTCCLKMCAVSGRLPPNGRYLSAVPVKHHKNHYANDEKEDDPDHTQAPACIGGRVKELPGGSTRGLYGGRLLRRSWAATPWAGRGSIGDFAPTVGADDKGHPVSLRAERHRAHSQRSLAGCGSFGLPCAHSGGGSA